VTSLPCDGFTGWFPMADRVAVFCARKMRSSSLSDCYLNSEHIQRPYGMFVGILPFNEEIVVTRRKQVPFGESRDRLKVTYFQFLSFIR